MHISTGEPVGGESVVAEDGIAGGGGRRFVCLIPGDDWSRYTRRPHLEALGGFGDLTVVARPLGPVGSLRRTGRARSGSPAAEGPLILRPKTLVPAPPRGVPPVVGAWRRRSVGRWLHRALEGRGIRRPVYFLTSPSQTWFFDLDLERQAVCFELSDEFSLYTQYPPARSRRIHRATVEMVRRSDLVFATARSLAREFRAHGRHVYWVPNTARPEDFLIEEGTEPLEAMRGLPRPVIGFIGGLNPWIDIPLVLRIQEMRPRWSIVFSASLAGPGGFLRSAEVAEFRRRNRTVRFLGWVPYPDLRRFLRGVDVCALFHRVSPLSRYIHPNKLYQYLAAGRPVVSTPFLPELETFGDLVQIARTAGEFVARVEEALERDGPEARAARLRFARANRPEVRAREKIRYLDAWLGGREEGGAPPSARPTLPGGLRADRR